MPSWSTGPGDGFSTAGGCPGSSSSTAASPRATPSQVPRYLPLHLVDTRNYAWPRDPRRHGARRGLPRRATCSDFPYVAARSAKEGEFRIAGRVEGATFDYVPSEPAVADKPACLALAGLHPGGRRAGGSTARCSRSAMRAQLGGVATQPGQRRLPQPVDKPVLALDGVARGRWPTCCASSTPRRWARWTGGALASRQSATGSAELKLGLRSGQQRELVMSTVMGSLHRSATMRITPDTPLMVGAKARIEFTHKGLTVSGASAKLLGGDATFDGSTQPDGSLRFSGQGWPAPRACAVPPELGALRAWPATSAADELPRQPRLRARPARNCRSAATRRPGLNCRCRCAGRPTRDCRCATRPAWRATRRRTPSRATRCASSSAAWVQAQYQRELAPEGHACCAAASASAKKRRCRPAACAPAPTRGSLPLDAWEGIALATGRAAAGGQGSRRGRRLPADADRAARRPWTPARQFNRVVIGASQDDGRWRANIEKPSSSEATSNTGRRDMHRRGQRRPGASTRGWRACRRPKSDVAAGREPCSTSSLQRALLTSSSTTSSARQEAGRVEVDAVNRVSGEGREAVREWRPSTASRW